MISTIYQDMAQISTNYVFVDWTGWTHVLYWPWASCFCLVVGCGTEKNDSTYCPLCVFLSLLSYYSVPGRQSHLWNFLQLNKKNVYFKMICDSLIFKHTKLKNYNLFFTWLHLPKCLERHIWWNVIHFIGIW